MYIRKIIMNDIVYFELNNWWAGTDYPDAEPFTTWMSNDLNLMFHNEEWVKQNKLCVAVDIIDMSVNFCITATKEWVLENCPKLLTDYKDFLRFPDEEGIVEGRFGHEFLEYSEENVGVVDRD
jgi:hypothetical protein